jgi:hypothetical protein
MPCLEKIRLSLPRTTEQRQTRNGNGTHIYTAANQSKLSVVGGSGMNVNRTEIIRYGSRIYMQMVENTYDLGSRTGRVRNEENERNRKQKRVEIQSDNAQINRLFA